MSFNHQVRVFYLIDFVPCYNVGLDVRGQRTRQGAQTQAHGRSQEGRLPPKLVPQPAKHEGADKHTHHVDGLRHGTDVVARADKVEVSDNRGGEEGGVVGEGAAFCYIVRPEAII